MEWRDVKGWEGAYQVSDAGDVRSVDRRFPVVNRFGNTENRLHRGKELRAGKAKNGYKMVSLTLPGRKRLCAYVHHLVAEAFLGPKPEGAEVCHNDGTRDNNEVGNLRYDSRSANALDRHAHGTMNQARGEQHYFAKLSERDVRCIRDNVACASVGDMASRFGVHRTTIGNVVQRKSWCHLV